MARIYEIRSSLIDLGGGKYKSSFEVLMPATEEITHYDTDITSTANTTILRYHRFYDSSPQGDSKGSNIITVSALPHNVRIEINSTMATPGPGGDVARKTDIAD